MKASHCLEQREQIVDKLSEKTWTSAENKRKLDEKYENMMLLNSDSDSDSAGSDAHKNHSGA